MPVRAIEPIMIVTVAGLVWAGAVLAMSPGHLDLARQPDRIRFYVGELGGSDKASWRQAQIRLASAGPAALDELERHGEYGLEPGRGRTRTLLSLWAPICASDPAARWRRSSSIPAPPAWPG